MKASEVKIGESCRHEFVGCARVDFEHEGKLAFITQDHKVLFLDPDVNVWAAFCFEGPEPPEGNRATVRHIHDCIRRVDSMWELNGVEKTWEDQMKILAAERLKPGSDEVIEDLDALDYIWDMHGDYVITGDQLYHARALDYYLGRKVSHVWGDGILMKIAYEYGDERFPKQREWFGPGRVHLSDPKNEFNLPGRRIDYGVAIKYPCTCGKVEYDMFAIPGVHTGGFAYLVAEDTDAFLDARNQCRVCEECGPKVKAQLEAIDRGDYDFEDDEDEDDIDIGGEG